MAFHMKTSPKAMSPSQNVSRETFSLLADYVNLLLKWNAKINLIGPLTESDVWSRHIDDSLQLLPLIPDGATSMVDLGSGAGLPGLVIAIAKPELKVTLVEQDQRKAAFLNEARRLLGLSQVTVEAKNILDIATQFDLVTARALAPLCQLLSYAKPLLNHGAIALFPKGANYTAELAEAHQQWRFDHQFFTSKTNPDSAIISISQLYEIPRTN